MSLFDKIKKAIGLSNPELASRREERELDRQYPVEARKAKRLRKASAARRQKKGQRLYARQVLENARQAEAESRRQRIKRQREEQQHAGRPAKPEYVRPDIPEQAPSRRARRVEQIRTARAARDERRRDVAAAVDARGQR